MSQLTISKLIKIVMGGFVLVVVILGLYFAMTSYIIPFFKGFGFGGGEIGGEILGEASICEGKTPVGYLKFEKYNYFWYENKKTDIYFEENLVKRGKGFPDPTIGRVEKSEIKIDPNRKLKDSYSKILNGTLIGGNEICKP